MAQQCDVLRTPQCSANTIVQQQRGCGGLRGLTVPDAHDFRVRIASQVKSFTGAPLTLQRPRGALSRF